MTVPAEPLPDDTQDPALDEIDVQDYEFTLEDLNAVFAEGDAPDPTTDSNETAADDGAPTVDAAEASTPDAAPADDEGGDDPEGQAGDDTPLEPAAQTSQTPDESAQTPDPASAPGVVDIGGQLYRADDVAQLIEYVSNLPADKQAILFGQVEPEPDPRTQLPSEEELVDPRLAQWTDSRFQSLESKLDAIAQQQQAAQAAIARQQEAELNAALDTARRGIAEAHGLTDAEAAELLDIANRTPAASAAMQTATTPVESFRAALETTYWITPKFRDRAIQDQVTTQVAELTVEQQVQQRRDLNQSLVGSGAAAPRAQAPAPQTQEEHLAAAVKLVEDSLSNN